MELVHTVVTSLDIAAAWPEALSLIRCIFSEIVIARSPRGLLGKGPWQPAVLPTEKATLSSAYVARASV